MSSVNNLLVLLKLLEKVDQKVGKTFVQKATYMLKDGLGEQLDYKFKMHFYGPFSQEISNDIEYLSNSKLIDVEYVTYNLEVSGYKIEIAEAGKEFLKKYNKNENVGGKIDKIIELIGTDGAKEMELLGTVLYFAKQTTDEDKIVELTQIEKSHRKWSKKEILEAYKKLKEHSLVS